MADKPITFRLCPNVGPHAATLADPSLSFTARGLLGFLTTQLTGYGYPINSLATLPKSPDPDEDLAAAVQELIHHGYAETTNG